MAEESSLLGTQWGTTDPIQDVKAALELVKTMARLQPPRSHLLLDRETWAMVREQIDQRNRERGEIKGHFGGIPIEIFDSDAELIRRMAALSAIDPELRIVPCTRHKKFGRDLAPLLLIEADRYEESGNERVASELRQLAEV